MKKIILSVIAIAIALPSFAQQLGTSPIYYNGGNVGIGTTSPAYLLQLSSFALRTRLGIDNLNSSGTRSGVINFTYNNGTPAWELGNDIEANGTQSFYLYDNIASAARLYVNPSGNVGIGTTSAGFPLTISTGAAGDAMRITNTATGNAAIEYWTANGAQTYFGQIPTSWAGISGAPSIWESNQQICITPVLNAPTYGINLLTNGNVGIGTMSPDQRLTVNGTIHSKEVKVDTSIPVPDYVFEDTYKLPDLTVLKNYLYANHHLPEIPSAAEIEKNGLNLSEMNLKLLKKVEELTLYLIDKDKQDKEKDAKIEEQQNLLKQQQEQINALKQEAEDNQSSKEQQERRIATLEAAMLKLTNKKN